MSLSAIRADLASLSRHIYAAFPVKSDASAQFLRTDIYAAFLLVMGTSPCTPLYSSTISSQVR